jgi:hypothetical protein
MAGQPLVFARPDDELMLPLQVEPQLASWMRTEDPSQQRLEAFMVHAIELIKPSLALLRGPLALRLDVAIPSDLPLLDHRDLDNYAFPLATRLAKEVERPIDSVWASKRHGSRSSIGIATPAETSDGLAPDGWISVRTTVSSSTTAYKQQVHEAVQGAEELPAGSVSLHLSFTVGPGRNWVNLWKPTIDALGPLLGSDSDRPWSPRDGRITELSLHRTVDAALEHDVLIAIAATNLQESGTT